MKRKIQTFLGLLCLMVFYHSAVSQTYVNAEWVDAVGTSDTIPYVSSCIDSDGNVIVVSNTQVSTGNTDIVVRKITGKGDLIWEQTFEGSGNARDYGVAVKCDAYNNVFVTGVISGSSTMADFVLVKYDESGDLIWSTTWDGGTNANDVPSCMAIDGSGNIFLAGGSFSVSQRYDYAVIKIDPRGDLLWDAFYDHADLDDYGTAIALDDNGDAVVTGASAAAANSWDYATIKFDGDDGSQLDEDRENISGLGLDKALAIDRDGDGNFYITGYTEDSYVKDMQTIKINSSFGLEWVETFDGDGLDDAGTSLGIDGLDNVYVAGYSKKSNGGSDYVVIKYDSDGNTLWTKMFRAEDDSKPAVATKIKVLDDGYFYVTGYYERNGGLDFKTLYVDADGKVQWEKNYDYDEEDDKPADIVVDGEGSAYVIGMSDDGMTMTGVVVKYSSFVKPGTTVIEDAKPMYRSQQVLVRFMPGIVNTSFVDNKELQFAKLADVIPDSILDSIDLKLGNDFVGYNTKVMKVVPRMTTADTVSITRLGESYRMPDFWNILLLELPPTFDVYNAVDSLDTLVEYFRYVEPNFVSKIGSIPNDDLFQTQQESLFPTLDFPDAHINVEPAWDIETGRDWVKVGIFDFTIWWPHADFGGPNFVDSKVEGGWDYVNNASIQNSTAPASSHGTACAGIVGALRNNGQEGIAGIAGGDVDGTGNTGVELFSLGIGSGTNAIDGDLAIDAIIEGAAFTGNFGYGLNIESHSWGGGAYSQAQEDAVESCWRNQCTFVAAKGNDGVSTAAYPGSHRDEMVIAVGASGTDGEYHDGDHGDDWWESNFGGDLDVIAGGVTEIVGSTHFPNSPFGWNVCDVNDNDYTCFNGTSAAAPHVAGVAALMQSHHNTNLGFSNNLAPEDVEFLIQRYATDIVNAQKGYGVGYDQFNGSGRVDASATMTVLDAPSYQVYHSAAPASTSHTSTATQQIFLPIGIGNLAAGSYFAERYNVIHTYLNSFSSTIQIIDSWERNSSVIGYSNQNPVLDNPDNNCAFVISGNTAAVTATTTCWHVSTNHLGQQVDVWIPAHFTNLRTAYSLHLFDPIYTSEESSVSKNEDIQLRPVPAHDEVTVAYSLPNAKDVKLDILDLSGKTVASHSNLPSGENQEFTLSLNEVATGIYICRISTSKTQLFRKLVKQ